jgi:hypothetical protein
MPKERNKNTLFLVDNVKDMVFSRRRQSQFIARLKINTKTIYSKRRATMP